MLRKFSSVFLEGVFFFRNSTSDLKRFFGIRKEFLPEFRDSSLDTKIVYLVIRRALYRLLIDNIPGVWSFFSLQFKENFSQIPDRIPPEFEKQSSRL